MFTSSQINEIKKKLQLFGVKDSQFSYVEKLKGDETVVVVQDGCNKRVPISMIMGHAGTVDSSNMDFVNVSKDSTANLTLSEAISKIDSSDRSIGQVITFVGSNGEWYIYQFVGNSLEDWNSTILWKDITNIEISEINEINSKIETNSSDISDLQSKVKELENNNFTIDDVLTDNSGNPVSSRAIYEALNNDIGGVIDYVDEVKGNIMTEVTTMETSIAELKSKVDGLDTNTIVVDDTLTLHGKNPVTSEGISQGISNAITEYDAYVTDVKTELEESINANSSSIEDIRTTISSMRGCQVYGTLDEIKAASPDDGTIGYCEEFGRFYIFYDGYGDDGTHSIEGTGWIDFIYFINGTDCSIGNPRRVYNYDSTKSDRAFVYIEELQQSLNDGVVHEDAWGYFWISSYPIYIPKNYKINIETSYPSESLNFSLFKLADNAANYNFSFDRNLQIGETKLSTGAPSFICIGIKDDIDVNTINLKISIDSTSEADYDFSTVSSILQLVNAGNNVVSAGLVRYINESIKNVKPSIDSAFSNTSTNALQNKVITNKVDELSSSISNLTANVEAVGNKVQILTPEEYNALSERSSNVVYVLR